MILTELGNKGVGGGGGGGKVLKVQGALCLSEFEGEEL